MAEAGARDPILDEYARLAPDYDRLWSFYVEATTRETLARIELGETGRLLDVGCGTGALLSRLASVYPNAELAGVDLVPEMLAVARRRLGQSVDLREGTACELPYEDGRFEVVVSCNMFHYIRKPAAALLEIRRVLRPRGRIVVTDWCDDYLACRICDCWLRLTDKAHFKTYGKKGCRRLIVEAGFPEPAIERYRVSWLWGLMTACAKKPAA